MIGPGACLGADVLDDLHVLDAGCRTGLHDGIAGQSQHLDDDLPKLRLQPSVVTLGSGDGCPRPDIADQAQAWLALGLPPRSRSLPATMNAWGLSIRNQTPSVSARSQFWQLPPAGTTVWAGRANRERS